MIGVELELIKEPKATTGCRFELAPTFKLADLALIQQQLAQPETRWMQLGQELITLVPRIKSALAEVGTLTNYTESDILNSDLVRRAAQLLDRSLLLSLTYGEGSAHRLLALAVLAQQGDATARVVYHQEYQLNYQSMGTAVATELLVSLRTFLQKAVDFFAAVTVKELLVEQGLDVNALFLSPYRAMMLENLHSPLDLDLNIRAKQTLIPAPVRSLVGTLSFAAEARTDGVIFKTVAKRVLQALMSLSYYRHKLLTDGLAAASGLNFKFNDQTEQLELPPGTLLTAAALQSYLETTPAYQAAVMIIKQEGLVSLTDKHWLIETASTTELLAGLSQEIRLLTTALLPPELINPLIDFPLIEQYVMDEIVLPQYLFYRLIQSIHAINIVALSKKRHRS